MSNVNKPVIPAEVADVIEKLRAEGYDNSGIVAVESQTGGRFHKDPITLRKIPFDTLLAALVNGYEREMTEEEQRQKAYADLREAYTEPSDSEWDYGFDTGIKVTLDTLGIKIEGINA